MNNDYHIKGDGRFYSVSHALARRDCRGPVRLDHGRDHKHRRVAAHIRGRARADTRPIRGTCPPRTAPHLKWTSSRLAGRARKYGTRHRPPSRGSSSRAGPTRHSATAAASASCGSPAPTPPNAWRPPAAARWTSGRSAKVGEDQPSRRPRPGRRERPKLAVSERR